jgi:transcriptional regulator with XRE-family HTH domain
MEVAVSAPFGGIVMTKQGGWPASGFGVRLRLLREQAGLNQSQLAERAGTTQATVARLEAGRQEPAWPLVLQLADALTVPLEEFRSRGDEPKVAPPRRGRPPKPKVDDSPPQAPSPERPEAAKETSRRRRKGGTTKPVLDGRAWIGTGKAYGTTFLVELFESRQNPGYYHYAMYCADDSFCDESKKPVLAKEEDGLSFWTLFKVALSQDHGLTVDDLQWREVPPEDLPLSGARVKRGE